MNSFHAVRSAPLALCALLLSSNVTLARLLDEPPASPHHEPAPPKAADLRAGDPYPLGNCPITGKKLGAMGDPVVKLYAGREVRFCCPGCPPKFEKDLAASLAALDAKIISDQDSLYPLKTSIVTGKDLPNHPHHFVYGNRLIRLGAESESADFLKDPTKYMSDLDKAVIAEQGAHYPLTKCPVSGDAFGGAMGESVDVVIAGRLIRLCCNGCKKEVEKDPAKFIALVDEARHPHPEGAEPAHQEGHHHDPK
jgi:hypothetical protein